METYKYLKSKYAVILLLVFTMLCYFIFSWSPKLTDLIYGQWIFPGIRFVFDNTTGHLPFSMMLIFIGLYLIWLIRAFISLKPVPIFNRLGLLIALFYWLWGFNYYRTPVQNQLFKDFVNIPDAQIFEFYADEVDQTVRLSLILDQSAFDNESIRSIVLKSSYKTAEEFSFLTSTQARGVYAFPESLFFKMGISGMYFPFTGQPHFEKKLGPYALPFTVAHEYFHAAGVASESACNFLSYITLIRSDSPALNYAAHMNLVLDLKYTILQRFPELNKDLIEGFSDKMRADMAYENKLRKINASALTEFSPQIIDGYLKIHQQNGIIDYNRLTLWVWNWHLSNKRFNH